MSRSAAIGERLLISPRFHRAHHGLLAAGQRSCNYGAVLPWWDMAFGTADFSRDYVATGDPTGEEALASGSYFAQQWAGLRRFATTFASVRSFTSLLTLQVYLPLIEGVRDYPR